MGCRAASQSGVRHQLVRPVTSYNYVTAMVGNKHGKHFYLDTAICYLPFFLLSHDVEKPSNQERKISCTEVRRDTRDQKGSAQVIHCSELMQLPKGSWTV